MELKRGSHEARRLASLKPKYPGLDEWENGHITRSERGHYVVVVEVSDSLLMWLFRTLAMGKGKSASRLHFVLFWEKGKV